MNFSTKQLMYICTVALVVSMTCIQSYASSIGTVHPGVKHKIILISGYQLVDCVAKGYGIELTQFILTGSTGNWLLDFDKTAYTKCAEEPYSPQGEWQGNNKLIDFLMNPKSDLPFAHQLSALNLQEQDFLFYSYTGEYHDGTDFRKPSYTRDDTHIGSIDQRYRDEKVDQKALFDTRAVHLQTMIDGILTKEQNTEFTIIGHSQGGLIAAYWAGKVDPDTAKKINAVITLDSPVGGMIGACWTKIGFLADNFIRDDITKITSKSPSKVPLYTFRHLEDNFVIPDQADRFPLESTWTDTQVNFTDNSPCKHGGVKENAEVLRNIAATIVSGAIDLPRDEDGRRTQAGKFDAPFNALPNYVVISKPVYPSLTNLERLAIDPITGLLVSRLTKTDFEVSVVPEAATVLAIDERHELPIAYLKVKPPVQDSADPSKRNLIINVSNVHITSSDTQTKSIEYNSDLGADIVLLLDGSGSMNTIQSISTSGQNITRWDIARRTAAFFLDLLDLSDNIAVIQFSTDPNVNPDGAPYSRVHVDLQKLETDLNRERIKSLILGTKGQLPISLVGGNTPATEGLLAAQEMLNKGDPNKPDFIIILSDGAENRGRQWNSGNATVEQFKSNQTTVHAIALGSPGEAQTNHALLDSMANKSDKSVGKFAVANDTTRLNEIYSQIVSSVRGNNVYSIKEFHIGSVNTSPQTTFVDSWTTKLKIVILWNPDGSMYRNVVIIDPNGRTVESSYPNLKISDENGYRIYEIQFPVAGKWILLPVPTPVPVPGPRPYTSTFNRSPNILEHISSEEKQLSLSYSNTSTLIADDTTVVISGESLLKMTVRGFDTTFATNDLIPITVFLSDNSAILNTDVILEVTKPNGQIVTSKLFDDSFHKDGQNQDGVYGIEFSDTDIPGTYLFVLKATGVDNNGALFERTESFNKRIDINTVPSADLATMVTLKAGFENADVLEYCVAYTNRGPAAVTDVGLVADIINGGYVSDERNASRDVLLHDLAWLEEIVPAGKTEIFSLRISRKLTTTVPQVGMFIAEGVTLNSVNLNPTALDRFGSNNVSVSTNGDFVKEMAEGWNFISLERIPTVGEPRAIFCPLQGSLDVVLGFDKEGLTYDPNLPEFSNLLELKATSGYWVRTRTPSKLRISGHSVRTDKPIFLNKGWNAVAYLPNSSEKVESALFSINGKYDKVLGFNNGAVSYYSQVPPAMNTLQSFEPGMGYWIHMTSPATLVYSTTTTITTTVSSASQAAFNQPQATVNISSSNEWLNIYSTNSTYNGRPLPFGAVVTAVGEDGRPLGAVTVRENGWYGVLAVYHDDAYTSELDGARTGERISFLINGQPATITNGATPTWSANGDLMQVDLTGSGPEMDKFFYLPLVQR